MKPGSPRSGSPWAQALLGGLLLVAAAVCLNLWVSPSSGLAAWGLDAASFIPHFTAQQQQRQQRPWVPPPEDLDLTSAVPRNGLLTKHGPSDMVTQLSALVEGGGRAELGYPLEWRDGRLAGQERDPPIKWCAVMFNDKYRVIYLKCPKTAGTPLILYFGECVPGKEDNKDSCLTMIDVDDPVQLRHLISVWPHYFVFGFTRNLFSRAISQYLYLTHFMARCPLVTWDEFCADPFVLGSVCYKHARAGNVCCDEAADHQYVHAAPQTHCFTTTDGRSAVDWLGRMELFDAEFAGLLELLNSRPGVPQLPKPEAKLERVNYKKTQSCTPSGGARRSLRSEPWELRDGAFHPCDPMDYFRGPHARCYADLLAFFKDDAEFLQVRGWRGDGKWAGWGVRPAQLGQSAWQTLIHQGPAATALQPAADPCA